MATTSVLEIPMVEDLGKVDTVAVNTKAFNDVTLLLHEAVAILDILGQAAENADSFNKHTLQSTCIHLEGMIRMAHSKLTERTSQEVAHV